jgi:hypothetical protein
MKKIIIFSLFLMSLTACGAIDKVEAEAVATYAAMGTPPPPKYQTAAAIYLGLTLTPTPTAVAYGTPTMGIEQYSLTMVAQQQNNSLTQSAQELALEREKLASEQRAEQAKATAGAAERTAEAINAQRTANAQATYQVATAQSNATATAQGLIFIQSTQAAHGVETQQSAQQTAVVEPTHAMWTATAVSIEQRIKEGQARDVELAVRRQEMKNGFDAYGPWLLVIFLAIVSREGFFKWLKTRIFKRDEHGKLPVVSTETDDGTKVFAKLDQVALPLWSVEKDGTIKQEKPIDSAEQSDVTRRTQAVEAISFLPTPYAQQGIKTMNAEFGGRTGAPTIRFEDKALHPVIDEAEALLMEDV